MNPFGPKDCHRAQDLGSSPLGFARHRLVISPVDGLLADLDQVRYLGCLSPDWDDGRLAMWQDDHDFYIEAELPTAFLSQNLDMSINQRKVFIRMGR